MEHNLQLKETKLKENILPIFNRILKITNTYGGTDRICFWLGKITRKLKISPDIRSNIRNYHKNAHS